ncbi:NADH:flavin oxidoreductase [Anaerobacillus sp. 1_MG-2023]|uniref:NADH:flavin oxidoreductase n=1 Tax=Anaerobacillus sp. 1_MG-2023 TaxID=3062655 RepID=UPI0026E2E00F|nr:NADH:flavin oxidoreductase [Anaerobacillus sp. 1_MG-2023]MDO6658071.1 NADH:flavin oxidoreductase [Anaerobacillus sp. 1_MG-2023]
MTYENLYTSEMLGKISLKNRFIVAPMTRITATNDGSATTTMRDYYKRFAKGGFGAIITEGIYTDERYSQGYVNQPGLTNKNHIETWRNITSAVHEFGTPIIAQLMHAGGQSQGNAYYDVTVAPSNIPPKGEQLGFYGESGHFDTPTPLSIDDIKEVRHSFISAARHAKEAGFDGVEIHGANGYLLDQFLTDYLNHRNDEYGGSLKNRLKLLVEVIEDVRNEVGEDFTVGIRLSQIKVADPAYKWPEGEKSAKTIFSILEKELDYIHVTEPDATLSAFGEGTKTLAAAAKAFSSIPVIANGQLGDPDKASNLIGSKEGDFVSLGTSALANPDYPNRLSTGKELKPFDFESTLLPLAYIKEHELKEEIIRN